MLDASESFERISESGMKFECVSPASRARLSAAISQSHRLRENNHRHFVKAGNKARECSEAQERSMGYCRVLLGRSQRSALMRCCDDLSEPLKTSKKSEKFMLLTQDS